MLHALGAVTMETNFPPSHLPFPQLLSGCLPTLATLAYRRLDDESIPELTLRDMMIRLPVA